MDVPKTTKCAFHAEQFIKCNKKVTATKDGLRSVFESARKRNNQLSQ